MTSKRTLLLLATLSVLNFGCRQGNVKKGYLLTPGEKTLSYTLNIDTMIIKDIRALGTYKIEPFHYSLSKMITKDSVSEFDPIFLKGLVINVPNAKSYDLVFALKNKLFKKGYSIFLVDDNSAFDDRQDLVAVLKTTNKYQILKSIGTEGINYDINNDSLITTIKKLDQKYALELIGASGDWFEFIIHDGPKDWEAFAEDIYKFCPDVVDQGAGNVKELAKEMRQSRRLYLWWD